MSEPLHAASAGGASGANREEAAGRIATVVGLAALDLDRAHRTRIPEVVLAGPKRPRDVVEICSVLLERTGSACVSRMRPRHRRAVERLAADRRACLTEYSRSAARLTRTAPPPGDERALVGLIAAGTSDLEALGEARMVVEAAGCAAATAVDVGVAGLHRLFDPLADLVGAGARVLVVAAGMDGALPSVVSGLVDLPVIGLPTSTGYGAGGAGRGALLAMLQACAPGLAVVNIDNGVGAGAVAARVALAAAAAG